MTEGDRGALRIVHLGQDSQFLAFAANTFEQVAPGSNECLIRSDGNLHHPPGVAQVTLLRSGVAGLMAVVSAVRRADVLVVHSMSFTGTVGALAARRRAVVIWSGWGGDYYGDDGSRDAGLLGPLTGPLAARLASEHLSLSGRVKTRLRAVLRTRVAARTDYFSAPIPSDLAVFKKRFPQFSGQYAQLSYASVEATFALGADRPTGNDILVGNSASFANNHLELFRLLTRQDLSGRRIVVPLSYGDASQYRDEVLARGRALFGDAFLPLVETLPLEQYLAIVGNCSWVVMGHRRQQALGNIGAALYKGSRVFLHSESPVRQFLDSRGAIVRPLTDLDDACEELVGPEPVDVQLRNRQMLQDFWGRDQTMENVSALIKRARRNAEDRPRRARRWP